MAKSKKSDDSNVLADNLKRFRTARKYTRSGFWDKWDDYWSLYNNIRVDANYEGNSDGFVPETFTILQTVKAHIAGGLTTEFLPTSDDQQGDVRVLNSLFQFVWDQDHTDTKVDSVIEDYLVVGNGYLFNYLGADGLPKTKYVPTKDAFFDPDATNYENLSYAGYRYLTTLEDLKDETITNPEYDEKDPKSTQRVARYKDLDKIPTEFKDESDQTAKEDKEEMLSGALMADTDGQIECIVIYDKKRMIRIANRTVVIEDVETPFQRKASTVQSVDDQGQPVSFQLPAIKPFLPVSPFRNYVDGALWYARGEIEIIEELQERLNDTQNQKTDNLSYILNRMWTLDPAYAHKIDEIQNVPGAVFTVPPGALEQVPTAPIGTDADNEIFRIKDEMRRATSADELIQGAQSATGSQTATEVNAQLNQAGSRFGLKLHSLENEGFRILAENIFKMLQIFVTKEMAVRMIGPQGVQWKNYNPGEFLGNYDVEVKLKATAEGIKEVEKQNAMQFFLLASKYKFVDQEKLFITTASKIFDKPVDQIEGLLVQQMPPLVPSEKLIETIDYKDAPPDIQAQMEAQAGFTPSTTHLLSTALQGGHPGMVPQQSHTAPAQPQPLASSQDASSADMHMAGEKVANLPGVPQA